MSTKKGGKRRTGYVYNSSAPRAMVSGTPEPEAPADRVKEPGTIKAQLIGKLGSRGYGRLLAGLREQATTQEQ